MDKIKAKVNYLKESIDACDEREKKAKADLKEATARYEAAEADKRSFKRRQEILEVEVQKTNERLAEKREKLNNLEAKTAADEEAVKDLESQEVQGDEKIVSLADMIKRGQLEAEDYEMQWSEAKRKKAVLLSDINKTESRLQESTLRIEELMETINYASSKIKVLEAREYDQTERENENEQKLAFLSQQEKEAMVRMENAERDATRLARVVDGLQSDIRNWKNKTSSVLAEIDEMNSMADDI